MFWLSRFNTDQLRFNRSEAINIGECSFYGAYMCSQHWPQCSHLSLYPIRKQSMTEHSLTNSFLASLMAITISACKIYVGVSLYSSWSH